MVKSICKLSSSQEIALSIQYVIAPNKSEVQFQCASCVQQSFLVLNRKDELSVLSPAAVVGVMARRREGALPFSSLLLQVAEFLLEPRRQRRAAVQPSEL